MYFSLSTVNFVEEHMTDSADQTVCKRAAKKPYEVAGIEDPTRGIDIAKHYDGFANQSLMWLEKIGLCKESKARKLLYKGTMNIDGDLPKNPSGGVYRTNATGSSEMNGANECATDNEEDRRRTPGSKDS